MTMEKTVKIPDLEKYEALINKIKDELNYSVESCDKLLYELDSNKDINNKERSNYVGFSEIDYLLTDLRSGDRAFGSDFTPLAKMINELKEFKENLDLYDSDTFEEPKGIFKCSMCDEKRILILDSNCCQTCLDSSF